MEFIAVAMAIMLPAAGSAIGQGWATASAIQGIARQPEAVGDIRTTLLIGLAFIEALTLFGFVMAILIWTRIG